MIMIFFSIVFYIRRDRRIPAEIAERRIFINGLQIALFQVFFFRSLKSTQLFSP